MYRIVVGAPAHFLCRLLNSQATGSTTRASVPIRTRRNENVCDLVRIDPVRSVQITGIGRSITQKLLARELRYAQLSDVS